MRAKTRKLKKPHIIHRPAPEPTINELAQTAAKLFNYGGDKTKYITFLQRYSKEKQSYIIKEMNIIWATKR